MDVTLEEARLLLARARVDVSSGRSPARAKVEQRSEVADAMSFGRWATRYFEFNCARIQWCQVFAQRGQLLKQKKILIACNAV